MPKIVLCQGIQGSGKSTWALKWAQEDPEHRVRWNNDDFRNLMGKYWVPSREHVVREIREHFIKYNMTSQYDIVVDDMNLNPKTIKYYKEAVELYNKLQSNSARWYTLEFKLFNTPLEVCIERDSKRENPIGKEVITETYNRYKEYLNAERNN